MMVEVYNIPVNRITNPMHVDRIEYESIEKDPSEDGIPFRLEEVKVFLKDGTVSEGLPHDDWTGYFIENHPYSVPIGSWHLYMHSQGCHKSV